MNKVDLNIKYCSYSGTQPLRLQQVASILPVISPIDHTVLGEVTLATKEEVKIIIEDAHRVFQEWRLVPAPKRGEVVRLIGEKLRYSKLKLAKLITLETGKIIQEALGEVQEMIDFADFSVGQARMLHGKTMHSEREQHRMYEQWHPLGSIGIITAFNFPAAVWAWNALIAVVAGNSCIWKPSPKTPLIALAIHSICCQVIKQLNFPPVFSLLLTQDEALLDELVNDRRLPLVSFTGSTQVGKKVATKVAQRLGRSILELGGNNAAIVDDTANLNVALEAILFSAIGTAGQRCTSLRRLFVHQKVYDILLAALVNLYSKIKIGNPFDEKNLMGPIIDKIAYDRYIQVINEVPAAGGKVIFGGKILDKVGYYVQPTLVTIAPDSPIVCRENFLPILFIHSFTTIEQAIKLQNGVAHGLSSALFSTNLQNIELFLSAVGSNCGIANINTGTAGAEIGMAFGGEKDSGGGREAGADAWQNYMRRQSNVINWGRDLVLAQGINNFIDNTHE